MSTILVVSTFVITHEEQYLKYPMRYPTFNISNIIESYNKVKYYIITKNALVTCCSLKPVCDKIIKLNLSMKSILFTNGGKRTEMHHEFIVASPATQGLSIHLYQGYLNAMW